MQISKMFHFILERRFVHKLKSVELSNYYKIKHEVSFAKTIRIKIAQFSKRGFVSYIDSKNCNFW